MSLSNPINPPFVESTATPVKTGGVLAVDENQTKINQIHGINPAGTIGAGIPKAVTNVSASMANASKGSTSTINIHFQRDPSDTNFSGVVIYAKGYQGNNSPVQVGASADSPCTVILNNTGESVTLILQSSGNGGVSPITSSPTCSIKLPFNTNGGAGTQTTTNLTLAQIPTSGTGSLSIGTVSSAPASVNLTTEGTRDWLIVSPPSTGVDIYSRQAWRWKFNSGDMLLNFHWIVSGAGSSLISAGVAGTTNFSASNGDEAADGGDSFTGGGAYPITNVSPWRGIAYGTPVNAFGFSLSCSADTTQRTINLYIGSSTGGVSSTTTVTAHLLDGSAPDQSITITATSATLVFKKVPITFQSKAGSRLVITVMITASNGNTPQVVFQAATIA